MFRRLFALIWWVLTGHRSDVLDRKEEIDDLQEDQVREWLRERDERRAHG